MTIAARRPTSSDVAQLSGVSRATVSYVLNSDPRQTISDTTRRRVLWAARELGYVPSAAATSLRRGHSKIVVIALDPLFAGHVSDQIVDAVAARLHDQGYVALRHSSANPESIVEVAQQVGPVGVIALTFITKAIRERLVSVGVRRILDIETPEGAEGPPDRPWELPIGQLQVDHLVTRGYDKIVYALPEDSTRLTIAQARLMGARIACTNLGIDQPTVIALPLDRHRIADRLGDLDRVPGRTGLCAYEDQIAIGVLGAMNDLGWTAPRDLAVIGSDDLPVSSLVSPALSTIAGPVSRVGEAAADQFAQLRDGEIGTFGRFDDLLFEVIQRAST
ncbi:LacI family DNA-binding transcriptional regulator [soil metagenome]